MELTQQGFLEELLLAPRRETCNTLHPEMSSDFYPNDWTFNSLDVNHVLAAPNSSFSARFSSLNEPNIECDYFSLTHETYPCVDGFTHADFDTSYTRNCSAQAYIAQEWYPSIDGDEDMSMLDIGGDNKKLGSEESADMSVLNMGLCGEKKKRKRVEGQPSKNLMAERRRRKRLNDRLSMLRSIVPKISKMDRTSILGDTIDYMKELMEKINKLQEHNELDYLNFMSKYNEGKPNESLVRNSPKFDVERRDMDTKIDIYCAANPGLLLSTIGTLDSLGLEINQCVISCFSEFSMQAFCSEGAEHLSVLSSDHIKQTLHQNAYGGRFYRGCFNRV